MTIIQIVWERIMEVMVAVGSSLVHNGWVLMVAIVAAVYIKTYVNTEKLSALLRKRKTASIYIDCHACDGFYILHRGHPDRPSIPWRNG